MSDGPAYPPVDPRRASDLRDTLLRDIAALAPDWKSVAESTGHDRALVEIAARMMAHSTRRLDRTAERDALAFLDMFDIPAPQPRAAEGHVVMALAEGRPGPQVAPASTPLEIATEDGAAAVFETTEPLAVHAGRITVLATVDPATDAIGRAPLQVTALEREGPGDLAYRLDAAAGPNDRVIRLSFATGIAPGDLLRFEDRATGEVRIRKVADAAEDGLVTLASPLGGAGVDVDREEIRRMTWLDAFAMPDLQEHALYLGDAAAFELTEPARIYLDIEPAEAAAALMAEPVVVEIWGQREAPVQDEAPAWHRLPPLGSTGGRLGFLKPWTGPVIEREIAQGVGGRWIRIRRLQPIQPGDGPAEPLGLDRVDVMVEVPPPPEDAGSVGISQAAHNATPLPVTSSFLPYGPEPQRFDTFALAAPETFTKAGARAQLDIQLLDASPVSLEASVRVDAGRHGYGVGTNGRLQVVDFDAVPQFWREAPGPEPEPGAALTSKLSPDVGPWAAEISGIVPTDVVVAGVESGDGPAALYAAGVELDPAAADGQLGFGTWRELPELPEGADPATTRALAMTPLITPLFPTTTTLVFVGADGVYRLTLLSSGQPLNATWSRTGLPGGGPVLDDAAALCPVSGSFSGFNGACLVTDNGNAIWLLRFGLGTVTWSQLVDGAGDPVRVVPGTVPAGLVWANGDRLSVTWAGDAAGVAEVRFARYDMTLPGGEPAHVSDGAWPVAGVPADLRLSLVTGVATAQGLVAPGPGPAILAVTRVGQAPQVSVILMDDETTSEPEPVAALEQPAAALPWAADGLGPFLAFSASGATRAEMIFAGREETVIRLPLAEVGIARFQSWATTTLPMTEHGPLRVSYRVNGGASGMPERLAPVLFETVELTDGRFLIPLPEDPGATIDRGAAIEVMRFVSRPETPVQYGGDPAFGTLIYPEESTVVPAPSVGDVIYLTEGVGPIKVGRFVVDGFDDAGNTGRISVDGAALDAFADGSPGPVRFRIASEVTYVAQVPPDGRLTFAAGSGLPTPAAGDVLVLTEPGLPGRMARFTVQGSVGTEIEVVERDELDAFMGAAASPVDWQLAEVVDPIEAEPIPPGSDAHYDTYVRVRGVGQSVSRIGVPDPISPAIPVRADIQPANAIGGIAHFVLPAWVGASPADGWVTALPPDAAEQSFVAEPLDRAYAAPDLSWEYFDGEGWARLDRGFEDTTLNLARSGQVRFRIPGDLSPVEVGGQEDLWIRARLIGGDYGRPRYVVTTEAGNPSTQSITVDTSHMRPPEVGRIGASFDDMPPAPPDRMIARNNLRDIDQSAANATQGAVWAPFEGVYQTPLGTGSGAPALYLGLSAPLPPDLVTLFVAVEDREADQPIRIETLGADLGWSEAPLAGPDPTGGLHVSGLIRFTVAAPMARQNLFGEVCHWIRIVGGPGWAPRITGMWLNGVPILQAETVRQELLGTTLGEDNTTFRLLKGPVLEGSLELRVRERLSEEEIAALRDEAEREGWDGPDPVIEDVPNLPGTWVLWRAVTGLEGMSGRVFRLTPDGTVTFGDGWNGRIPPAGRDSVRAFAYQTGGQRVAVAGFAEAKPRLQVPGFERAFVPDALAGGAEAPTSEDRVARMPAALRHQGQALSLADLEAIARDADSEIVQVRARAAAVQGGPVRIAVLARGAGRAPVYGRARREGLVRALADRMSDAWAPGCLDVRSVSFVDLRIAVTLLPEADRVAEANAAARSTLWDLFHPAKGGPSGAGWPPGRRPWPMDVERALAGLPGIRAVVAVRITKTDGGDIGALAPDAVVVVRAPEDIRLTFVTEDAP
ncbi:MAG: hypothetical protein AAFR35_09855 [Pseudomonadota bacterium]